MDRVFTVAVDRGRVLVVLMLMAAFFVGMAGCGDDSKPRPVEPRKAVSAESAEMDEETSIGAMIGEDLGVDCETHEYVLGPGDGTTLDFQLRLDYATVTVAGLDQKPLRQEEINIKSDDEYWKKTGATIELADVRLEETVRSVATWGVDSPELAEAQGRGKKLMTITRAGSQTGNYKVRFGDDGIGIFIWLGPAKNSSAVTDLSQEEVADILGGEMVIQGANGQDLPPQLDVTEIYADRTDYHLNLAFRVRMPEKPKKNLGCKSYHRIWAEGFGTLGSLRITYTFDDQRDGLYHVTGPAEASYCEP